MTGKNSSKDFLEESWQKMKKTKWREWRRKSSNEDVKASWERRLTGPDSPHLTATISRGGRGAAGCFQTFPRRFSRRFNQTLDAPPRPPCRHRRTAASSPSSSSSLALCSLDSQTGCSLFLPQCHLSPITWRYANSFPAWAPDISAVTPQIDSSGKHVRGGLSSPAGATLPFSHVALFIHHSEV